MKKYFAFAAAAIMMVACNVEELKTSDVQENGKINLTASINSSEDVTRAKSTDALQDIAFVSGKTIFVEAYETGASTPYTTGTYTTGEAGALTGGLYYPANNHNVDICAYYPSSINSGSTTFSVQADQSSDGNDGTPAEYQNSDLMYATKLTNCASIVNNAPATHNLTFNHALTKIVVNISLHESMANANLTTHPAVTKVELKSTVLAAQLSITNGAITAGKVTAGNPAAGVIDITGTGLDNMGIIVPQTVAAESDFITLTYNGDTYTYKLDADKTFLGGKVYTFELTLTARGLLLQATQITDWVPLEGTPANDPYDITI